MLYSGRYGNLMVRINDTLLLVRLLIMKQHYQKSHDRVKLDVKPVNITVYNIYFVTTAVLSLVLNFALYILGPIA